MKVLLANKFFFLNGGSETVLFQEREYLRSNGIDVIDFSMHDARNFPSNESAYFVANKSYTGNLRKLGKLSTALSLVHSSEATKKIGKLIDATKPDLLHCHNIYHQLTPSIIGAAKKRGVPVVLTLHDSKPVCPTYLRLRDGKLCSDCLEGNFFNVLRHRCANGSVGNSALLYVEALVQHRLGNYERVDRFIAPSQFMAESVKSRFPAEKLRIIPNGIDTGKISAYTDDWGYALYIGRLSQEKGINTLLDAYRRHEIHFPLKVCGTGPLLDELLKEPTANVEFLGYKMGTELQTLIAKSSFVVVPSECYENCPMSILEAMAYGKPVIASHIGGIPELVADKLTGLLHEPSNIENLAACINQLAENSSMRKSFGLAARQRAENHFSLEKHNTALLAVYHELTGN